MYFFIENEYKYVIQIKLCNFTINDKTNQKEENEDLIKNN